MPVVNQKKRTMMTICCHCSPNHTAHPFLLLFSTPLVLALFLAAPSLLLCSFLKCFFVLVYVIFVQYSKRCSKNIRDRSNIEITRTWRYNQLPGRIYRYRQERHVRRLRARESRDFHVRGTTYRVTFQESCS